MPGGGKPVVLASLSRSALIVRSVMGSLIAVGVLLVTAINLVRAWEPSSAGSAQAAWWLFVGFHAAGMAFGGWWLVGWNAAVISELRRRRTTSGAP